MKIVILAGGSGTRLWPLSREKSPKQLQKFLDGKSLLQVTVERAQSLVPLADVFLVIANVFQLTEVQSQLPDFIPANILREPRPKNTTAAIAYGAAVLTARGLAHETMVVLSADHVIANPDVLWEAVRRGEAWLATHPETLLTIGITPHEAETGYGYIELGEALAPGIYRAAAFREKPPREIAEQYLTDGRHLWNAGTFIWKVTAILKGISQASPEHRAIIDAVLNRGDIAAAYEAAPNIAIDYAVLEKNRHLAVIPTALKWRDIGHWRSLKNHLQVSSHDSVVSGRHVGIDTKDCFILGKSGRLIATIGIEGLIIVDTDDALLICRADQAQDVRRIVESLNDENVATI